jgi:sulfofructose kinase
MATVVCVGISVHDIVFRMTELPRAQVKHYALGRSEVTGGIAANAARTVARLGGRAVLGSRLGEDLAATSVLRELAAEGVDVRAVHAVPGGRTSLSAVMIDPGGERMLVNDTDPRTLASTEGVPLAAIERADAVLADTRWADGATLAVRGARLRGIPAVLDFDRAPEAGGTDELLVTASHVLFGRQGLLELIGSDEPGEGLGRVRARSRAWLGVTRGEEGVFWLEDGSLRHLPAHAVAAVDTLAAGDVFHGAFALALAEGESEPVALRFANAAAAIKCTRPGGGAGAPRRAEVEELLRKSDPPPRK